MAILKTKPAILSVDDEKNLRKVISTHLSRDGFSCLRASDGKEAMKIFQENPEIDVVLTDLKMPRMDGVELLGKIKEISENLPVIILTAHGSINNAVAAVKAGAFDYIEKPFEKDHLLATVNKAVKSHKQIYRKQTVPSDHSIPSKFNMVGVSSKINQVFTLIEKISPSASTVLITGESGTGKELVAQAIHNLSPRKNKPFVRVNCAAIPENLTESEFFGYEKGAFTGAVSAKPGKFELAHKGTLLLDEISEIPLFMQAKLLRVLQENEFERVGGIETIRIDVRIIACTNHNLKQLVEQKKFREDLYYRLNVVPVNLAPLRERKEDIKPLIDFFCHKYADLNPQLPHFTQGAVTMMENYSWPGNIRELENLTQRILLLSEGNQITVEDLPGEIIVSSHNTSKTNLPAKNSLDKGGLKEVVKQEKNRIEKEIIAKTLKKTGGNVSKAAKLLKISRKGLQNKIKEFAL
ncbi:MAG: sigma-54 dependent transcriptional regulator [Deltaproteobacteria bacterium]|jgi:two-component system response regulator AtoC|nr:sigma-54 dependent transcriptional regulator [Deltaproteobacteria bacterium]